MLASAAALCLLGLHSSANALALGAAQIKSALGEPLRVEVEVPDITSEEAATFQATLGRPQEFQAAGVDYNSQALRGLRITLNRRPNGQAYLRIQGVQPVNEPFLTILINANWASGRVVRDYTLLIDPPHEQAAASATVPARQQNTPVVSTPRYSDADPGAASESAAAPSASPASSGERVHVQPGDTATSIIEAHPVEGVSLDQMLVALLQANPRAFIRGNVNLIRAGAVINMPNAEQAAAVPPQSARRMLIAQSRDFRSYRRGLAMATAAQGGKMAASRRSATGNVQSQVRETGAAPGPQDRLTLSRGQPGGNAPAKSSSPAETSIAQSRHAQEQAAREAELRRNISELSQLAGTSGDSAAPAAPSKPSAPGINVPVASAAVASAAVASAAAKTAASTPPAAAASAQTTQSQPAPRRPAAVPPPSAPESSLMDTLLSPLTLGGAAVLVLLLGGYAFYRSRRKNSGSATQLDSDVFTDSKLPPDSYFGVSGGQRVDTRDDSTTVGASSSMAYSPSQLEAVGDIDPVSEADVYLAYGRDAQAEEILKEALRTYPGRTSIYVKLAEIYAKQRDADQLATIAAQARRVTHGEGHDWQAIINLGKSIDPANPLYAPDNVAATKKPSSPASSTEPDEQDADDSQSTQNSLDLDLTDKAPLSTSSTTLQAKPTAPAKLLSPGAPTHYAATVPAAAPTSSGDIDFTLSAPIQPSGTMKFDTSVLPGSSAARPAQTASKQTDEDPLVTKLGLAQEFHAIGDNSSARALAKEVLAEATGALKTKAERLLKDLG